MDGADVGVVERGCGTRFALEAFKRQLGYRGSAWQDLDGHHTSETRVRRPIHLTHPSAAERRDDLVGAEARASSQRHEWIGTLILVADPVRGKGKAIRSRHHPSRPGVGRCRLKAQSTRNVINVKTYHDIVGDGGSRVLEQVAEQRTRITDGLAGVRHLVAVGSGKGGVGKSTLTLHLAGALRARGLRIAILDADFNGPSQARMAGVQGALFVPGSHKVALPRTRNGIGVFSMGSLIPESEALEFESAAHGRVPYVARHEGVRSPQRDPRVFAIGESSICCCSICRREPSGPSSTPIFLDPAPRSCS